MVMLIAHISDGENNACRNRALGTWWRSSRRQQLIGEGGPHLTTGLVRSRDGMRAPHLGALVSPQDAAMTTFLRALAKSLMRSSPDGDSLRLRHACRRRIICDAARSTRPGNWPHARAPRPRRVAGDALSPVATAQQAVAFSAGISDDLRKVAIEAMVDAQSDGVHFTANVLGRCGL